MKIARNVGTYKNVTTELSLQLIQNMNEAMADMKYKFPPLKMPPIQRADPFVSKATLDELYETLSHCLHKIMQFPPWTAQWEMMEGWPMPKNMK